MNSRLEELARRRADLVARSDSQRAQLTYYYQQLEGPLKVTEATLGLANALRRAPLFVTGLAAVLLRTPWRRLARIPKLAWRGWKILRFVRSWAR